MGVKELAEIVLYVVTGCVLLILFTALVFGAISHSVGKLLIERWWKEKEDFHKRIALLPDTHEWETETERAN